MFNVSGGEIIVILLLALVVLGPEKLPEALRRAGRTYAELKKMGNSFQTEMRSVLDEPMKEMRDTADLLRKAVDVTVETATTDTRAAPKPSPAVVDEPVPEVAAATAELESVNGDPRPDAATNTLAMDDHEVQPAAPAAPAPAPAPTEPPPVATSAANTDDDLINRTLSGD